MLSHHLGEGGRKVCALWVIHFEVLVRVRPPFGIENIFYGYCDCIIKIL